MAKRYGRTKKIMSHKKNMCSIHNVRMRMTKGRLYTCHLCELGGNTIQIDDTKGTLNVGAGLVGYVGSAEVLKLTEEQESKTDETVPEVQSEDEEQ